MKKEIFANDIKVTLDSECDSRISIEKNFPNEGKIIEMHYLDDIEFNANLLNERLNSSIIKSEFRITMEDKIYFALNRLIGNNDMFIIGSDDVKEKKLKYLEIKRESEDIIISFHDFCLEKTILDRFNIKIKHDLNDKNYCNLVRCFKEMKDILVNLNHQYTLDEYFEILNSNGSDKKGNPFLTNENYSKDIFYKTKKLV